MLNKLEDTSIRHLSKKSVCISWNGEQGFFGSIVISRSKSGMTLIDSEALSKESVMKILEHLVYNAELIG